MKGAQHLNPPLDYNREQHQQDSMEASADDETTFPDQLPVEQEHHHDKTTTTSQEAAALPFLYMEKKK